MGDDWTWVEVGEVDLTSGEHRFQLRQVEGGLMVDRIIIDSAPR